MSDYTTKIDIPAETRTKVIGLLSQQLADTLDLFTQIKQAHWNVKGIHFIALHELFDKLAEETEDYVDDMAERILWPHRPRRRQELAPAGDPAHRPARQARRRGPGLALRAAVRQHPQGHRDRFRLRRRRHLGPVHRRLARAGQEPVVP